MSASPAVSAQSAPAASAASAAPAPLPRVPPAWAARRRTRPWWGDAVGSAALLSVTIVLGLWLSNRGLQELTGSTSVGLTSAGRLLGLLAADLLLLQCLLMARVPWVERTWGQDRLARWHRVTGSTSFYLMAVHVALVTLGYAASDHRGVLGEAWDLVTTYPGMLLATAGTALLVMVTVTSVRAARRRLRYESWHLLHLYAYLGVGLALPHQVWTGTEFTSSAPARTYWWSLWIAAALAVLVFRVGVPVWRNVRHQVRVAAVVPERPGVVSVVMRGRHLDRLPVEGGQFVVLRFLDGPGWTRGNPYSLSAAPHPSWLRVTVLGAGDGSRRAAGLRPGTRVLLEGPYGRLTASARQDPRRPVVLLGSGVGMTPLRALAEELDGPGGVTLVQRARSEQDLLFRAELDDLARTRGLRVHHLVGPRARSGSWLPAQHAGTPDAEVLRALVPDVADADVYVCGPPAWADAAAAAARAAGVPRERVHEERFAW